MAASIGNTQLPSRNAGLRSGALLILMITQNAVVSCTIAAQQNVAEKHRDPRVSCDFVACSLALLLPCVLQKRSFLQLFGLEGAAWLGPVAKQKVDSNQKKGGRMFA